MIELPEAIVVSRQMNDAIRGKRIASGMRGNALHKFAFYNREPEEYAAILPGKEIGEAREHGSCIFVGIEPDYALQLGGGGERIRYHTDASTVPARHQLLVSFDDGTHVSVTVQGWGSAQLWHRDDERWEYTLPVRQVHPLGDAFTPEYVAGLFGEVGPADSRSIKYFAISKPQIWGLGNGCLHDILFRAKLHPKRRAADMSADDRHAFYEAVRETLSEIVAKGGRDTELDLYGKPGGYKPVLDRFAKGQPCPQCASTIEVISYLGGKSYFCPGCQT